MQEYFRLIPMLGFLVGLVAGFVAAWFVLKNKFARKTEMYMLREENEKGVLRERLVAREKEVEEFENRLSQMRHELDQLRKMLGQETERRAAAEAQLQRMNRLEELLKDYEITISNLQVENSELKTRIAEERKRIREQLEMLDKARQNLSDTFKALSAEALKNNNQSFLTLAKSIFEKLLNEASHDLTQRQKSISQLVEPIKLSLEKVDEKIQQLEKARTEAYASLYEQLRNVGETQKQLYLETSNLVKALRMPAVRGRWGEIQLRRVVEIAGMVQYCDFIEQKSINRTESRLRPDMIINLPGERIVIVDAKAPLQAYLESLETDDEEMKLNKLKEHARQIRSHINMLSNKNYWRQIERTPEFTVLFLPGEAFFSAALEHDPGLIEYGADRNIIVATPTTLIALLRAVAYGWKQEQITANARLISQLGNSLYDRIRVMAGHFTELRKNLERSVMAYNKTVRTLETRVLVTARKFKELGSFSGGEIGGAEEIDKQPVDLKAPEFEKGE